MIVDIKSASEPYADDVLDFSVNNGSQTYLSYSKISHLPYNFLWAVPNSGNYSFVYDNSLSTTSKNVIAQLTSYWSEAEHHTVNLNRPIIPFDFVYVGVVLALTGISLVILGILKKKLPKLLLSLDSIFSGTFETPQKVDFIQVKGRWFSWWRAGIAMSPRLNPRVVNDNSIR